MFEYTLIHWGAFFSAAVLLNLSPGPDMAFILGQTVRGGRPAGFAAMLGIWAGAFVHVVTAAVGLSAVLATSAIAFTFVKWAGVLYLIWIGMTALRSKGGHFYADGEPSARFARHIFRQGVLVAILNPKVAIFFLAFLPQFVVEGAGPAWAQLLLHGSLIIAVAACIELPLVLAGARLTAALKERQQLGQWLDRALGTLLVGLGVRLALSDR